MASMFSPKSYAAPTPPAAPKPVRMQTETDPEVLAASQRARDMAMKRTGRLSTILTDQTRGIGGSSYTSQKLGGG